MIPVCPKCDVQLFALEYGNVEADYCHSCKGVWLDQGELEHLASLAGASTSDPLLGFQNQPGNAPGGSGYLCPRCDTAMREVVFSAQSATRVVIEKCPRGHGLWFDAGELRQLLEALLSHQDSVVAAARLNEIFGMKKPIVKGDNE